MKLLKRLAAAVAVVALMASVGVSSAPATALCKTQITEGCTKTGQDYGIGTTIHLVRQSGKHVTVNAAWTDVTCKKSTMHGKTNTKGSETEAVKGPIEVLTLEQCSCAGGSDGSAHPVVLDPGSFALHHITGTDNATVTSYDLKVTANCTSLGTQCIFGTKAEGTVLGTLTGGNPATATANATVNHSAGTNDEGSFLCGSTAKWEAAYEITEPNPVWVATD